MEDRLDNIKKPKRYSVDSVQRVRDELYTLIPPTLSIVPVGNVVAFPSDYNYFLRLDCVIDGKTYFARPTTFNELGVLSINPFKKPSNTKPYHYQNASGLNIKRGAGGSFTSALLDYVKNPAVVSIGNEGDKISSGAAVLTVGVQYMVYEEAVHAGLTYAEGQIFTATAPVLTSGIVIPNSVIVNCDFPVKLHEEVTIIASAVMNGTVSDFSKKQDLEKDAQAT